MKKQRSKKFLAAALAGFLAAASVMPASAADSGSLDVEVSVTDVVIRVQVPTTMLVAIDEFETEDDGSQIYSTDFTLENRSAIPVEVDVESEVKPATGSSATLKDKKASVSDNDDFWMAAVAQVAEGNDALTKYGKTIDKLSEEDSNVATFESTSNKASQVFCLDKGGDIAYKQMVPTVKSDGSVEATVTYARFYELESASISGNDALQTAVDEGDVYKIADDTVSQNDTDAAKIEKGTANVIAESGYQYYKVANPGTSVAAGNVKANTLYVYGEAKTVGGEAAFRYIGALSAGKEWTTSDIEKVTINYEIKGLSDTNYKEKAAKCKYGWYNDKAATEAAPSIAVTSYKLTADTALEIEVDLGAGELAATDITSVLYGTVALGTDAWSFNNNVLTISSARVNSIISSGTAKTHTVVFNDTNNTKVDIVLDGTK